MGDTFDPRWRAGLAAPIAGVDEAGRGPCAGPVVAAAVLLDPATAPVGLADSKTLTAARRDALDAAIRACAPVAIGIAEPAEIERLNIRGATLAAMARAIAGLRPPPGAALVDGDAAPDAPCPVTTLVRGDARDPAVAAASIVAKVARDRLMVAAARRWPGYGFETHKGYPTQAHAAALRRLGPCPIHRRSFAPVKTASLSAR